MQKRSAVLPAIIAIVALLGFGVTRSIETTVVPEWKVQVVDSAGAPVANVQVRESWKHYGLEFDGRGGGEEDKQSDHEGYVVFPQRTIRASVTQRIVAVVTQTIRYQEHSEFGARARVQVCVSGSCESLDYKTSPSQITMPPPPETASR